MKPLPAHLPPLPENAVYLGMGKTFDVPIGLFDGWISLNGYTWVEDCSLYGNDFCAHYACPKDSPIAILNGLGEPEIDWKKRAEELEVALQFYADSNNWKRNGPLDGNSSNFTGGPAYEALKSKEKP